MQKMFRILTVAVVVANLFISVKGFAANAPANSVVSTSIAPADNKTGQTLTVGNGVKTGHIQDGAITSSKIAPGAVSSSKIFGQLSTSKLRVGTTAGTVAAGNHTHIINTSDLAAGAVTSAKLAAGSVVGTALADGSVSNAKITGTISVEKLGAYASVKIVHKGSADGVNTFNSVLAALIAVGHPVDRQAILVMPGKYEEDFTSYLPGRDSINVDIIGQSRTGTIIKAIGAGDNWLSNRHIELPSNTNLKNLTFDGFIRLTGGAANVSISDCTINATSDGASFGLALNDTATDIVIDNVIINAAWNTIVSYDLSTANTIRLNNIQLIGTTPGISLVYARAYPYPIRFTNSIFKNAGVAIAGVHGLIEIENSVISVSSDAVKGCVYGSTTTIRNSKIEAPFNTLCTDGLIIENSIVRGFTTTTGNVMISNSRIMGGALPNSGIKYFNAYDDNFDPIANGVH